MFESINWQILLSTYLIIGALAVTFLWIKRSNKQKPTHQTFANKLAAILEPMHDRHKTSMRLFLERRLLSACALLVAWLVWPLIVVVRLWVAMLRVVKKP